MRVRVPSHCTGPVPPSRARPPSRPSFRRSTRQAAESKCCSTRTSSSVRDCRRQNKRASDWQKRPTHPRHFFFFARHGFFWQQLQGARTQGCGAPSAARARSLPEGHRNAHCRECWANQWPDRHGDRLRLLLRIRPSEGRLVRSNPALCSHAARVILGLPVLQSLLLLSVSCSRMVTCFLGPPSLELSPLRGAFICCSHSLFWPTHATVPLFAMSAFPPVSSVTPEKKGCNVLLPSGWRP